MRRSAVRSLLLLAVAIWSGPAGAAQMPPDTEAQEVILRQLAAFRAGDYRTAYTFASKQIQAVFDLADFERMVKTGYPQIAQSVGAWVTETETLPNGAVHIYLRVRGADGVFIVARYEMLREEPGWRINGVAARRDPATF